MTISTDTRCWNDLATAACRLEAENANLRVRLAAAIDGLTAYEDGNAHRGERALFLLRHLETAHPMGIGITHDQAPFEREGEVA